MTLSASNASAFTPDRPTGEARDSHVGLTVALVQFNPVVGDLAGNVKRLADAARRAHADGARLVVAPELAICGYPPEDLLLRPAFMAACEAAVQELAARLADLADLHVVVGHPAVGPGGDVRTRSLSLSRRLNAASVLHAGQVRGSYAKRELPNYQVFDERRYFVSGREVGLGPLVFTAGGRRIGVLICEDAWFDEPGAAARVAGAEALVVLNASPFHVGKLREREDAMRHRAVALGLPLFYAHMVGGQDEVVFDGCSFVLDARGELQARSPAFEETILQAVLQPDGRILAGASARSPAADDDAQVWGALVTGVRDYLGKNGFPGAIVGLSGGIDSALVLAVAADALGAERVRAVMMPSPYTAEISWIDARDMAARLGVRYDEIPISDTFESFRKALAPQFVGLPEDTTEENIQARIRGTLLMALSNKTGAIVLTTGNKSELATGYCTLYGDMAGGYAVIKDLAKTLVYRLAHWRNAQGPTPVIPDRIITRPPSAELRPGQVDQDSLPPYEVLDAIVEHYMEHDRSIDEIIELGFARTDVEHVTRLIKLNEYKRRQAPVGVRITHRAFGRDWRYPITSKFRA